MTFPSEKEPETPEDPAVEAEMGKPPRRQEETFDPDPYEWRLQRQEDIDRGYELLEERGR